MAKKISLNVNVWCITLTITTVYNVRGNVRISLPVFFLLDLEQWHHWLRIGKEGAFPKSKIIGFHSCLRCFITTLLLFRSLCKLPLMCMWSKASMISFKNPSEIGLSSFFFFRLDKVTHLSFQLWNFVIRSRGSLLVTIGTLRYTTARCYYGYFGRDGLGWLRCFTRQSQMVKILLYGNSMCSLYES